MNTNAWAAPTSATDPTVATLAPRAPLTPSFAHATGRRSTRIATQIGTLSLTIFVSVACSSATPGPTPTPVLPIAGATSTAAPVARHVTAQPPPQPGAVGAPTVGITKLPPVAVGAAGKFSDVDIVATVKHIDPVQLEAHVPGEIAGPGVGVTMDLTNSTSAPIDLDNIVVNSYYGKMIPAPASSSKPAAPLTGDLAPGHTKTGVYAFQVPADAASAVIVEVNYTGSADVISIRR